MLTNEMKMKNNTGKLLAAVLAMFMVVAGAVVILSDSEVNADEATVLAPEIPTKDPFEGMYTSGEATYDNGVLAVSDDAIITLTKNVGEEAPINMQIKVAAGATLTIKGDYSIHITNKGSTPSVLVRGNDTNNTGEVGTLALVDGVKAYFATDSDTAKTHSNVIGGVNVTLVDAELTLSMSSNTEGVAFYNDTPSAKLSMSNSTLTLDHAGGINAIMDLKDGSKIVVVNPKTDAAYITLEAGSSVVDSMISTPTGDNQYGVQIQKATDESGPTVVKDSKIYVDGAGIFQLQNGADLDATGSTISAPTINVRQEGTETSYAVAVTGGTFSGNITKDDKLTAESSSIKFYDTNLSGATVADGMTVFSDNREFSNKFTLGDGAVIDKSSSIITSTTQEVIISGNVKVVAGGVMTISGKLTIQDGATLTLEEGAVVTISNGGVVDVQGDLVIEGAPADETNADNETTPTFTYDGMQMIVAGSVLLDGDNSFVTGDNASGLEISGTMEIGDEATANLNGAKVVEGGELLVYGTVDDGITVTNNGIITVDSEDCGDFAVVMGNGAELDLINAYGTITVSDKAGNTVSFANISGAKIGETVTGDEGDEEYTLSLSGNIAYAIDATANTSTGTITVTGGVVSVEEDAVLTTGVTLSVTGGTLDVSANLDATAGTLSATAGEITVTGKITTKSNVDSYMNGVKYTTTSATVYTTLVTALDDGATSITVLGKTSVDTTVSIPSGTGVTLNNGSELTISEDATVTVVGDERSSATLSNGNGNVVVKGTLVLDNTSRSKVDGTNVVSDTFKTSGISTTYTNIYNAVENANDGETVTISSTKDVTLTKDLTVGSGVTLSVPASKTLKVGSGVTLTVDGTVSIAANGTYTMMPAASKDAVAGQTVVNGLFVYSNSADYSEKIVGAYFKYKYNNATVSAIAPLASVPGLMENITGNTITTYGEMTVGDIDFSAYTGTAVKTLAVSNNLTFGTITLGTLGLTSTGTDVSVTGTIQLTNGTLVLDNVYGVTANNTTDRDSTVTSSIGGEINAYDDSETTATEKGSVEISGTIVSSATYKENVALTVPAGATLSVTGGTIDDITVEGTLTVSGTGVSIGTAVVTGTVGVPEKSTNKATVTGTLYVGVSIETSKSGILITDLGGDASVAGVTLNDAAIAYVSPSATAELPTGIGYTEYYVDGELYVTAYVGASCTKTIDTITISVENAFFKGWNDETGEGAGSKTVGSADVKAVYAGIKKDIYTVNITADGGIGTVALDGVVLTKNGNTFSLGNQKLEAGTYQITFVASYGFTADNAYITVNGEKITGNTITLSGTPVSEEGITFNVSIMGTEVANASTGGSNTTGSSDDDDGLGLTDILLIVLVVLIAVMAVMVALRLMRS